MTTCNNLESLQTIDVAYISLNVPKPVMSEPCYRIELECKTITSEIFKALFYANGIYSNFSMNTDTSTYGNLARYLYYVQFASQKIISEDVPFNLTQTILNYYESGNSSCGFSGIGPCSSWSICSKMELINELNCVKYIWGKNKDKKATILCKKTWKQIKEEVAINRNDPDGCVPILLRVITQISNEDSTIPPVEIVFRYIITDFKYDFTDIKGLYPNIDPTDLTTPDNTFTQQETKLTFNAFYVDCSGNLDVSGCTMSTNDNYCFKFTIGTTEKILQIKLGDDHTISNGALVNLIVSEYDPTNIGTTSIEKAQTLTKALVEKLAMGILGDDALKTFLTVDISNNYINIKSNFSCGPNGFTLEMIQGPKILWETLNLNEQIYLLTKTSNRPLEYKCNLDSNISSEEVYNQTYNNKTNYEIDLPSSGQILFSIEQGSTLSGHNIQNISSQALIKNTYSDNLGTSATAAGLECTYDCLGIINVNLYELELKLKVKPGCTYKYFINKVFENLATDYLINYCRVLANTTYSQSDDNFSKLINDLNCNKLDFI